MVETKNVSRPNTGNVFCVVISFAMLLLCCYTIIQERKVSGTLKDMEFRIMAAEQTSTRTRTSSVPLNKKSDVLNRNEVEKIITDLKKAVKLVEATNARNRVELRKAVERVKILEENQKTATNLTRNLEDQKLKAKATIKKTAIKTESGYNVIIHCEVEGFPKPTVSWERVGKILQTKAVLTDDNKTLKLIDVGQKDAGDYVCQARNSLATSRSLVSVAVFERLKFLNKLNRVVLATKYLPFKISCLYSGGIQPVHISWERKGKKLPKNVIFSQNNQTLEIRNFQVEDVGTYLCNVRSVMSEISQQTEFVYTNMYLPTCKILRDRGVSESGNYLINPSGDLSQKPVQVYCDMNSKLGRGVTLVSHDSEARTRVAGLEGNGQYKRPVNYNMPNAQIEALKRLSKQCDQFIKYECVGSGMWLHRSNPFAWWVSFNGLKMKTGVE